MFILTQKEVLINVDDIACIYRHTGNGFFIQAAARRKNTKSEPVIYTLGEYSSMRAASRVFEELKNHIAASDSMYEIPEDNEDLEFDIMPDRLEWASESDLYAYMEIIERRLKNKFYPLAEDPNG